MPLDLGALVGGFAEHAGELMVGYGIGTALHRALEPEAVVIAQDAWRVAPTRAVPAEVAAAIVAEDVQQREWGRAEAAAGGFDDDRFDAMLGEQLSAPGLAPLFEAWRRDLIDDAAFEHGLRKAKLEPRWDEPLKALKSRLLSLDELANARQQGFIDQARQYEESALQGLDRERAELKFDIVGLPPGPETMQRAANRGLVDRATFDQAIREGHTKTKYDALLWDLRRPVLAATDFANLYLRGWISEAERDAGGALTGYSSQQMQQMYLERGRPAAPVQMFTAWARSIDGPDHAPMDEAQFLKGIRESDIRPEWGPMLWGIRHAYPSLFQLRAAVQSGGISRERALTILKYERYESQDATAIVDAWISGGHAGAKAETRTELRAEYEGLFISEAEYRAALEDLGYSGKALELEVELGNAARVKSLRDRIVDVIRDEYLYHEIDEAAATSQLARVNVVGDAAGSIVNLWGYERSLVLRRLTPPQIKKAYGAGILSRDAALTRLGDQGYSAADAATLLDE